MKKTNAKNIALVIAIASFTATASGCGSGPMPVAQQLAAVNTAPISNIAPLSMMNGCVPLNQPIGFRATGIYMDNQSIYAGIIPPLVDKLQPTGAVVGQVVPSSGAAMIGAFQTIQNQLGMIDGSLSLSATPLSGTGGAIAAGTIILSQTKLQIIYGLFGLNYSNLNSPYSGGIPQVGFPNVGMSFPQTQQAPCVSGIGISMTHFGTTLYGGRVYLYLNGSQHGDYLQF